MKLSECYVGMIVKRTDAIGRLEYYQENPQHIVGYIKGLAHDQSKGGIVMEVKFADGYTYTINPEDLEPID